ncbi:hypothetical protein PoB_004464000 [Plakobranchus ocellatus]|uniref:Uncharacterized protein n=1 Tax=Plakobranchus ocellatus TaxID=259542 RepID=A0AAV4BGA6_9GAST|nr:hypothetical protein PoB_004464000 [Plakobranchus ocellatus]
MTRRKNKNNNNSDNDGNEYGDVNRSTTIIIIDNARVTKTVSIHEMSTGRRSRTSNDGYVLASPKQGDLRLLGPPSGLDAGSGARSRNRRFSCRSQGGLANYCATDAPEEEKRSTKLSTTVFKKFLTVKTRVLV